MKALLRKLARAAGLEVRKRTLAHDAFAVQAAMVHRLGLDDAAVLDVGAHRGETALHYARMLPRATVYAFEPFPDSFVVLRDRCAGERRIVPVQAAVSDRAGEARLHVMGFSPTHSLLPRPSQGRRYYPRTAGEVGEVTVPTTTVDAFVAERGIGSVSVLKLDIQGAELLALRGARELLAQRPPALIFTEVQFVAHYEGAPPVVELWQELRAARYSLVNFFDTVSARNGQLRFGDALFVHEPRRAAALDAAEEEP